MEEMNEKESIDLNGPEVYISGEEETELLASSEMGDEIDIRLHEEDYFSDEQEENLVIDESRALDESIRPPANPKQKFKKPTFRKFPRKPQAHGIPRPLHVPAGQKWVRSTKTPNTLIFKNQQSRVSPTNQVNKEIFSSPNFVNVNGNLQENLPASDLRFLINKSREQSRANSATTTPIPTIPQTRTLNFDGNYRGPENENFFAGNFQVKDELQNVKEKVEVIDDDSDDEIEVVSIKTSDNRTFFALKDEIKEEEKKKDSEKFVQATKETLSQRFARVQEETQNEIQFKEPSRTQEYLKGSINSQKFNKMKLNLKRNADDLAAEEEIKKARIQAQCIQVEISDLPPDWIKEGVSKIRSIANAYGTGSEEIVENVFQLRECDSFIVIFKQSRFAIALYHGLNGRVIDDKEIVVKPPTPRTY